MRGQFKKQDGKIEDVDLKKSHVYVAKIEHTKRDGTKAKHPLDPSNLMIIELNTDDKKRFGKSKDDKEKSKAAKQDKPKENVQPKSAPKKTESKPKVESKNKSESKIKG